jgi:hypothetical protein
LVFLPRGIVWNAIFLAIKGEREVEAGLEVKSWVKKLKILAYKW